MKLDISAYFAIKKGIMHTEVEKDTTALVIGENTMAQDIISQLTQTGHTVEHRKDTTNKLIPDTCREIVILTPFVPSQNAIQADTNALAILSDISKNLQKAQKRDIVVHLQLQSATTFRTLYTLDLKKDIIQTFEVCPFTFEDAWSEKVLVQMPDTQTPDYPPLDREPVTKDSKKHVHLVISGFDAQGQSLAIHTALTAHFPNYNPQDKTPLRTRITVVDKNIADSRDKFIADYQHLFDNSFYRFIDTTTKDVKFHYPRYYGERSDFVDVEWEFVEGDICSTELSSKLAEWAEDENKLLTIAICNGNDEVNLSKCLSLAEPVFKNAIPVFLRQNYATKATFAFEGQYANVFPFGKRTEGYNVRQPLRKMAKLLNYFYNYSYSEGKIPTSISTAEAEKMWTEQKSLKLRLSSIYNVMTMACKMRCLNHTPDDATVFYALSQREVESLAETEHNRWSVERLILGMRPCTTEEKEEIRRDKTLKRAYKKKNIHFDLCAYHELEEDETGKNAQVYDYDLIASISLIVKSFADSNEQQK